MKRFVRTAAYSKALCPGLLIDEMGDDQTGFSAVVLTLIGSMTIRPNTPDELHGLHD